MSAPSDIGEFAIGISPIGVTVTQVATTDSGNAVEGDPFPGNAYPFGNGVVIDATFKAQDGTLWDPPDATIYVQSPSGLVTPFAYNGGVGPLIRNGVGDYCIRFQPLASGIWTYGAAAQQETWIAGATLDTRFLVIPTALIPGGD